MCLPTNAPMNAESTLTINGMASSCMCCSRLPFIKLVPYTISREASTITAETVPVRMLATAFFKLKLQYKKHIVYFIYINTIRMTYENFTSFIARWHLLHCFRGMLLKSRFLQQPNERRLLLNL